MTEKKRKSLAEAKKPHVVFMTVKKYTDNETKEITRVAEEFLIDMDTPHAEEAALANFIKQGARIVRHENLDPKKHANIIRFIDTITGTNIDPLILAAMNETKPASPLKEKVANEQRSKA